MLVLSRKVGESIVIGANVQVTVTDIYRGKIRLAVSAPRELLVLRKELLEKQRRAQGA